MSPVLFITFMDKVSRRSQRPDGVRCRNCMIASLLFTDDVVIMASLSQDLQCALGWLVVECEAAGMKIIISKFKVIVLNWKYRLCPVWVGGENLLLVEEMKYLCIFSQVKKGQR